MMATLVQAVVVAIALGQALGAVHRWPNPRLDRLEDLRWSPLSENFNDFGSFVNPCNQFGFGISAPNNPPTPGGRTNAADWLRTAYHDMANADVHAGTGGLDASIRFGVEQSRPENAGDSFNNTVLFFQGVNRYVTLADMIAIGAVTAVEQCGGPEIPFRAGRIDAVSPGPPGTPKPEEDLISHTEAFARMGFSGTEMIQLIACGHTMGGVQARFFPDIVPESEINPDTNRDGNAHFESKFALYDNTIATEFISGDTQNPLVVGFNVTTRSDMRIFSSDGNATMRALAASNEGFLSTCGPLLERMLNTVPREVTLTDVIEPLPAKPQFVSLMRDANGSFVLQGSVRLWNLKQSPHLRVNLSWAGEDGRQCSGCSIPLVSEQAIVTTNLPRKNTLLWFHIPPAGVLVEGAISISKFWFDIIQDGQTMREDQGGIGFPLQTDVVAATSTCMNLDDGFLNSVRADIAVKKGLNPTAVWVEGDAHDDSNDPFFVTPLRMATFPAQLNQTASARDQKYDIYSVTIPHDSNELEGVLLNVAATINGKNVTDWATFNGRQTGRNC